MWLEFPLTLFSGHVPLMNIDTARQTGQVVIGHAGATLPAALFPAKSRARCRLLVRIPRRLRDEDWDVYVSQLYEGFEVGRITWRIARIR